MNPREPQAVLENQEGSRKVNAIDLIRISRANDFRVPCQLAPGEEIRAMRAFSSFASSSYRR